MTTNNANAAMQGFSKMFSQGVQMNQQKQQNEVIQQQQQQQLDMMQNKYDNVVKRQFRDDWNKALFEGDNYGNWNRVEQFMAANAEEFGSQRIKGATQSDIFEGRMTNGKPSISPETRSNYLQDTGIRLPTDEGEAADILQSSAMIEDEKGRNWINPAQLSGGLSNYKSYKDERLRDMKGTPGKPDYKADAAALRTKSNAVGWKGLSEEERNKFDVAAQDSGVTKQWAIQDLGVGGPDGTGLFSDQTSLVSNGTWKPEIVDPKAKQLMFVKQQQAGYKFPDASAKVHTTGISQVRTMRRVYDAINNLSPAAQGEVENFQAEWAARAKQEDWDTMSKPAKDKIIATIKKNTITGAAAANIVADISGATVPEEEMKRWEGILFAGGANKVGKEALLTAISTNLDEFYSTAKGKISDIDSNKYGYNKVDYAQKLEQAYGETANMLPEPKVANAAEIRDEIGALGSKTQTDLGGQAFEAVKKTGEDILKAIPTPDWVDALGDAWTNMTTVDKTAIQMYDPAVISKSLANGQVTKDNINTPKGKQVLRVNQNASRAAKEQKFTATLEGLNEQQLIEKTKQPGITARQKTLIVNQAIRLSEAK